MSTTRRNQTIAGNHTENLRGGHAAGKDGVDDVKIRRYAVAGGITDEGGE